MAINPDKCIKVTGRFHSTQGTVGDPSLTNVVAGADEVYDDNAPYRSNGHIDCAEVTPAGTENPKELRWYETVEYSEGGETLTDWVRSQDTAVDAEKTYGIPTGAKQSVINDQLYEMVGDIDKVVLYADEYNAVANPTGANPSANGWYELSDSTYVLTEDTEPATGKTYYVRVAKISTDENKIINQQDGYIPTAGAVGRALGANFEDNLQSTSTVKGLTANMGRVLNENKADINGYYETMSVGSAKNLDGETINSEAYLIRPTGGDNNEVVSGLVSVVGMEGNSAVWNQLISHNTPSGTKTDVTFTNNGNGSWTVNGTAAANRFLNLSSDTFTQISGHKYLVSISPTSLGVDFVANSVFGFGSTTSEFIIVCSATGIQTMALRVLSGVTVSNVTVWPQIIDLTLIFEAGNEPSTVAEFKAWLAQHVGTKPYYAYNAGTILSANTLGFKTYSRNLLNPSNGLAKLIPYTHTTNSNKYTVKGIPTGAAVTYTPDNTGVAVDVTSAITDNTFDISSYGSGTLYIPNATANTYVCMKYDGAMDGNEFIVPYKENTYNFDVTKVYGKTGGSDTYVQCFPNGMRSAGNVHETLTASEAVVKINSVDLGTIEWNRSGDSPSGGNLFVSGIYGKNAICVKYVNSGVTSPRLIPNDSIGYNTIYRVYIRDDSYTDAATFKAAMSGVILYHELDTHIIYTDLIYRDGGVDRPLREVLVNLNVDNWSMEEQLMTPYVNGNPTSIPATIQTKYSIDAVEAIKTLEESSYFESDIHDNLQAMLTCINTNCSSVLGGQFSISETATNKLFNFTFTTNASTNSTEENTETI